MADGGLRELERAWRASAAPEDELAYLRARVRAGVGTQAQTEVGAALAQLLLLPTGAESWRPQDDDSEIFSRWDEWAFDLHTLSRGALGRVLLAPAGVAHSVWSEATGSAPGAGEWVTGTLWSLQRVVLAQARVSEATLTCWNAFDAALEARDHGRDPRATQSARCVGYTVRAFLDLQPADILATFRLASTVTSGLRVLEALRADVLPWALGNGDPPRERLSASRNEEP